MAEKERGLTYAQAGVDIDAGNRMVELIKPLVRATARPGRTPKSAASAGLFDLKPLGFKDPVLVAATDGVGTKVKIAIETGRHDTIGIDLVAMTVNDLVVQGAEPLFFLDYFACGKLEPEIGAAVVAGIADGCREAGCALIGGETAEMPGLYQGDDYDLAGFAVGAAERGDAAAARATSRKATSSSGSPPPACIPTAIRWCARSSTKADCAWSAPAPFAPEQTLGEAILTPTRIYVKSCLAAIRETKAVKGLAHITGGGFPDNIPRVLPKGLGARIDLGAVPVLPVFKWLAREGGIAQSEMLRTFNCGIGMIVIAAPKDADAVTRGFHARRRNGGRRIGSVVRAHGEPRVVYDGKLDLVSDAA